MFVLMRLDSSTVFSLQYALFASDVRLLISSELSRRLPTNLHFFHLSFPLGAIEYSSVFDSFTFKLRSLRLLIVSSLTSSSTLLLVAALNWIE